MAYQHTLPPGTVLNGEYRIQRVLGSGGFANTYLATDMSLNRDVAIKEYFPSDISIRIDGNSVRVKASSYESHFKWGLDRFVREAKTLAKFRHPNIVRVFRTFDANETAYTVLDFVKGADMEAWLKDLGRTPSQPEIDQVLAPILDALEIVHDAGILHRDIKPANIYIRSEDQQPVLLDFGAARYAVGELTGTTAAIVSRGYSPHEAYATDNKLQGPWTDIYGLAATLHRALSGKEPTESTLRVLDDALVPASKLKLPDRSFRPQFLHSIDWGLSVLPNDRPRTVDEWRSELFQGISATSGPITGPRTGPRTGQRTGPDSRPGTTGASGPASGPDSTGKRFSHPKSGGRRGTPSDRQNQSGPPSAGRKSTGRSPSGRASQDRWGLPPGAEEPSRPKPSEVISQTEARRTATNKSVGMIAAAAIALIGVGGLGAWQAGFIGGGSGGGPSATIEKQPTTTTAQNERQRAATQQDREQTERDLERKEELARLRKEVETARRLAEARAREREQSERAAADRRAEQQRVAELAAQKRRAEEQRQQELEQQKAKEEAERRRLEDERIAREQAAERARQRELLRQQNLARERELAEKKAREDEAARARQREALRQENLARERRMAAEREKRRAEEQAKREAADRERTRLAMLQRERDLEEAARKAQQARELAKKAEAARLAKEAADAAESARRKAEQARAQALAEEKAQAKADAEAQAKAKAAKEAEEEAERIRVAALLKQPDSQQRTVWVKEIQTQLKASQCFAGDIDGATEITQNSLKQFEANLANSSDNGDYQPIKLASANVGEFNTWLGWFRSKRSFKCPLFQDRSIAEPKLPVRNRARPTQNAKPKSKSATKKTKPRVKKKTVRKKTYSKPKKKTVVRKKKKSYSSASSGRPDRVGGSR